MNHVIEDMNYYSDSRVIATDHWYSSIDEKRMVAVAKCLDGETEGEEVSFKWDVCPTCAGKGSHINPSIDSHGIPAEFFSDDPEFAEDYRSGVYDVPCYGCQGLRVVPVCDDPEWIEKIEAYYSDMADMRAEQLAEMRMGA